jgi:hypothetical protein
MFFVYVDCKPNGEPFYIGKGTLARVNDKRKRNAYHTNVCNKYPDWYRGIAFMGNEKDALSKEIELIAKYKDIVVNQTSGGQGVVGIARTSQWKAKISEAAKKQWANVETRQKMSENMKKALAQPDVKLRAKEAAKKRGMSKSALSPYICLECGKVTASRWINQHQKNTIHIGKEKL